MINMANWSYRINNIKKKHFKSITQAQNISYLMKLTNFENP